MSEPDNVEALANKVSRGDDLSAEETMAIFKTADVAGMLYYRMLTIVREQRSLKELPETLQKIIATEAWKRWRWVGSEFHQNSLGAYLMAHPPNGVGMKPEAVEKLITDDPEAAAAFRDEMTAERGTNQYTMVDSDNITIHTERGTSRGYLLSRLKRERPDLFESVKAGHYSANAAAIKAGFRKKLTPLEIILKQLPKLTDAEWQIVFRARGRDAA